MLCDRRGLVLRTRPVRDGPAVRGHPDRLDHLPVQDHRRAGVTVPLAVTGRLRDAQAAPLVLAWCAEVAGLVAFTIGARHGIAVAGVLGSQFAAIATVAAFFQFRERLGRVQLPAWR